MADIKDYIKRLQNGTVSLEEQQLALSKIEETIKIAKQKRDEAVGQKADMVVEALKQIETRLNEKYEELLQTPAMVGEQGPRGPAGRDGKDGLNGRDGKDGVDGKDGKDGVDGVDGISVVDARVDFDGGLVITLSDGSEIDAGQIFSPEVAQNIQVFRGGGGTSLPDQANNSGKYLTTNGSELSWATVSGGSGSGDVAGPASATDNAVARYDSTTGKLIQNSVVIVGDTGVVTGVTELTASTKVVSPHFDAQNSAGGALRNASGTPQLQWGGGGGNNITFDVAANLNPANAQIDISPTGTGTVRINPATASSMNNVVIGATTPLAGSFTNLSVTGTTSFDGSEGTAGQVLTSAGTGATPIWTDVVTPTGTQTLTNKRINPRAVAAGSTSGNLTPNGDTTDVFNAFGLTGAITLLTPSGTPVDGQRLMLRFEDNGTGRAITWTTSSGAFRAIGVTLPTTTVASKVTYVGCVYNSTDVFWDVIAVATQA
jgi:hypothetical protein